MEKIWLKNYPSGVPAEIGALRFRSIGHLFEQSAARFATKTAYSNMGRSLTYEALDRLSGQFAAYLQSVLRVPQGARVALMMPNVLQYPVALFGTLRAGYTVVNCNPLYTARELEHQLRDSGARVIVILENFAHTLQEVMQRLSIPHVVVTSLGEMLGFPKGMVVDFVVRRVKRMVPTWSLAGAIGFHEALAEGARHAPQTTDVGLDDPAFLQYTGGTTGVSKGAVLTHRNILVNVEQVLVWARPFLREGEETIVTALPLYHIFALTANCLVFLALGAANLLITNPRDIPGFVKELGKVRFTVISGVNTLFNALLNNPNFHKLDFSALKIAMAGGMALQQSVAERWKTVTGNVLIEGYGLTETSPVVTINPLDLAAFNHSIGLPVPSTEVSIRDDEGHEVALGQTGELCVRGPQVMAGYWNRPDETASVMTADGFLRTGDIAAMDPDGFVRLVDRKKDMILVSGFNVYPNEVEEVVAGHPGVLEVAAIGVPDEHSGEAVKIFVVRKDPGLTQEALIAHCRESLTAYKVPHLVEFRNDLPKTNVGKILRRALKDAPLVPDSRAA